MPEQVAASMAFQPDPAVESGARLLGG